MEIMQPGVSLACCSVSHTSACHDSAHECVLSRLRSRVSTLCCCDSCSQPFSHATVFSEGCDAAWLIASNAAGEPHVLLHVGCSCPR
jgi:hypothetical protein